MESVSVFRPPVWSKMRPDAEDACQRDTQVGHGSARLLGKNPESPARPGANKRLSLEGQMITILGSPGLNTVSAALLSCCGEKQRRQCVSEEQGWVQTLH